MAFPHLDSSLKESLLSVRVDEEGVDASWLYCLAHLMRDVLRHHGVVPTLPVLLRPLRLVFWVDKNLWMWMWEGAQYEFDRPIFNRGISATWRPEPNYDAARAAIVDCLASGRPALVRMEWFHVRHSPHFHRGRLNLHTMAILEYHHQLDQVFVVDRTARPVAFGGLERHRGWVPLSSLHRAIDEEFAWLDYRIQPPTAEWIEELRGIVRESAMNMRNTEKMYGASADYGIAAIDGMMWMLRSLTIDELQANRIKAVLTWHLPACIRKNVIGTRQLYRLALHDFLPFQPAATCSLLEWLPHLIEEWDALATSISRLGLEGNSDDQARSLRYLANLKKLENEFVQRLEVVAT